MSAQGCTCLCIPAGACCAYMIRNNMSTLLVHQQLFSFAQQPPLPPICCSRASHCLYTFFLSVLQLRLNAQQLDEKRAAESAVDEIRELLDAATSEASKDQLQEELKARQAKLDELMAGFEVRGGGAGSACTWSSAPPWFLLNVTCLLWW